MDELSFNGVNSGSQIGVNYGEIHIANRQFKTPQEVDEEVLESLAFPQMLDRRDNVERCHDDTCRWILDLEDYQSWASQSRGILWIKGKPGAGKSTLMRFLYDRRNTLQDESKGIWLDFFFTARGTELQRKPLGMLRSLLNQILVLDTTVRPQVREIYEERSLSFGKNHRTWEWTRLKLEELFANVVLASAGQRHVTVFVDALDESGAESAQQMALYFHQIIRRAERLDVAVRICISCRHYPMVESTGTKEICVEDHNHEDISRYIKDMLLDVKMTDHSRETSTDELVDQLIQHAANVFQWARIMIPLVRQRIWEGESLNDIRCWLRDVPKDLEDVYSYILKNVIGTRNRVQSYTLFQWVCFAERPLTVTEIRYAFVTRDAGMRAPAQKWEDVDGFIETDSRMVRRIKALSGGLAEIVSSGDHETVQAIHQSVNDFLRIKGFAILLRQINGGPSQLNGQEIIDECQATLYRSSLVYLTTIHLSHIRMFGFPHNSHDSMDEVEYEVQKTICRMKKMDFPDYRKEFPFASYATQNLFLHGEKCAKRAAKPAADVLKNECVTLKKIFDRWLLLYRIILKLEHRPPRDTALLHVAAAANLNFVVESLLQDGENVMRRDNENATALHSVARRGHIETAKLLLDNGAEIEATDLDGNTALAVAAGCGNLRFVEWICSQMASTNASKSMNHQYTNPLQIASLKGQRDVVSVLLDTGVDVNDRSGEHGHALQAAAANGGTEIVRVLLGAGADVSAQGGKYGNSLQASAANENTEIAKMLLDAGADVNAQGGEYGNSLQAAVAHGSTEIVKMLLDAGADANAQGGEYGNSLQAAVAHGSTEIVKMLLDAGADVNAQGSQFGSNALRAAVTRSNTKMVQMLIEAGADVNTQDSMQGYALHNAAAAGGIDLVQILLDAGADVNTQGGMYGSALQAATKETIFTEHGSCNSRIPPEQSLEILRILLDAGADVNAQGGEYGNALQSAALEASYAKVKLLLDAGADPNARGGLYSHALGAAVHTHRSCLESLLTMKTLIDAGANVNALSPNSKDGCALQYAAMFARPEDDISMMRVQMLLDLGADVDLQGGRNGPALQIAASKGNIQLLQMLLDAGADVNLQGGEYGSALQASGIAYWGGSTITKMLLDAGANVNAEGGIYGRALQAAATSRNPSKVQMLLDAGADVNASGGHHGSALHAALSKSGDPRIIQILLHAGANVNARDGQSRTPLLVAMMTAGSLQIQELMDAGSDALLTDDFNQAPLHIAASRNRHDLLAKLPILLSTINQRDKLTQTALNLAICRGHIKFAMELLHRGADPELSDGYGRNILDWVAQNNDLSRQIQDHCPEMTFTPIENQRLATRQSILQISNTLLRSKMSDPSPLLLQLGRYLLSLDDMENAHRVFQLYRSFEASVGTGTYSRTCDYCTSLSNGALYICRACPHIENCSECVRTNPHRSQLHPRVPECGPFEVPEVDESSFSIPAPQRMSDLLSTIVDKLSTPRTLGVEVAHSDDSAFPTALNKSTLISEAGWGPYLLSCAILLLVFAVVIGK